jgi:hypothetical protein
MKLAPRARVFCSAIKAGTREPTSSLSLSDNLGHAPGMKGMAALCSKESCGSETP